jgi:hypothetical protein
MLIAERFTIIRSGAKRARAQRQRKNGCYGMAREPRGRRRLCTRRTRARASRIRPVATCDCERAGPGVRSACPRTHGTGPAGTRRLRSFHLARASRGWVAQAWEFFMHPSTLPPDVSGLAMASPSLAIRTARARRHAIKRRKIHRSLPDHHRVPAFVPSFLQIGVLRTCVIPGLAA